MGVSPRMWKLYTTIHKGIVLGPRVVNEEQEKPRAFPEECPKVSALVYTGSNANVTHFGVSTHLAATLILVCEDVQDRLGIVSFATRSQGPKAVVLEMMTIVL